MTPQEAIKNLKKLKSFHNGSYGTAIDFAIKALEQTELNPSYNGVKSELEKQPCEEENPNCTECRYYDKEKHHCPRFCRVIEDTMAEITSEHERWIPVNERLPEEYKRVLVSDTWSGVYVGQYIDTEENWGGKHFINEGGIHSKTVVAWQPLPQPYAESEEEK